MLQHKVLQTKKMQIEGSFKSMYKVGNEHIDEGVYSEGLVLDGSLKEAIETAGGGEFFHFEETANNEFTMKPKMPEYGSASIGGSVFKMRVNNNRLVKGIANHFFTNGEIDFAKGYDFINEIDARLGLSELPINVDMFRQGSNTREEGLDWLATELDIPANERGDFKNFADAMFYNQEVGKIAPYMSQNFSLLWGEFAAAGLALDPNNFTDMPEQSSRLNENLAKKEDAIRELRSFTQINPETEMRLFVPTECSGSLHSNKQICDYSGYAAVNLGKPAPAFSISDYSVDIAMNDSLTGENKGERKWDQHVAAHIGNITLKDGSKYQLTLEAFAPQADRFMDHPAMTSAVSIGLFKDEEAFKNHYYNNAHIEAANTLEFCERKQELKNDKFVELEKDGVFARVEDTMRKFAPYAEEAYQSLHSEFLKYSIGSEWENSRNDRHYKPIMGFSGLTTNELDHEFKSDLRMAKTSINRIPEEHREEYKNLLNTLDQVMERSGALGHAKLHFNALSSIIETNGGPDDLLNTSYEITAELEEKDMEMRLARTATRSILATALTGSMQVDKMDKEERASLEAFLGGDSEKLSRMIDMSKAVAGNLLAPTEITMDIQVPDNDIANDFVRARNIANIPDRSKEFASHNFDLAFSQIVSKKVFKTDDHKLFDNVYIDGRSATDIFKEKHLHYASSEDKKADIMKSLISGSQIDFAYTNQNGDIDMLPLHATSDIPVIANSFLKTREKEHISVEPKKDLISNGISLPMPENFVAAGGDTVPLRENYNYLIKGVSSLFLNEAGDINEKSVNKVSDFTNRLYHMYANGEDILNPAATKEEVSGYRDKWLCGQLEIPNEKQADFTRFWNENFSLTEDNKLITGRDLTGWSEFANKIQSFGELEKEIGPSAMNAVRMDFEKTFNTIKEVASIDPATSDKTFIPVSRSAGFLTALNQTSGAIADENGNDIAFSIGQITGDVVSSNLLSEESKESMRHLNIAGHFCNGIFQSLKEYGEKLAGEEDTFTPRTSIENELFRIGYSAREKSDEGFREREAETFKQKSGLSTGLVETLSQNIMETKSEKANTAMWALEELTGAKLLGSDHLTTDMTLIESALSKVYINGKPYTEGLNLDKNNVESALADFTDKLQSYMDLSKKSEHNLSMATENGFTPITYNPRTPVEPKTSINIFSGKDKRTKHRLETERFNEETEIKQKWDERNAEREKESNSYHIDKENKRHGVSFEDLHNKFNPFKDRKTEHTRTRTHTPAKEKEQEITRL